MTTNQPTNDDHGTCHDCGNPAVLRMKFERDGCVVTATALDIGEMPRVHYTDGYTVQRCDTAAMAVITGNIISINPNGEPNAYAGAGSTTYISVEQAQSAMHGLAAAVNEMGRIHAPQAEPSGEVWLYDHEGIVEVG